MLLLDELEKAHRDVTTLLLQARTLARESESERERESRRDLAEM